MLVARLLLVACALQLSSLGIVAEVLLDRDGDCAPGCATPCESEREGKGCPPGCPCGCDHNTINALPAELALVLPEFRLLESELPCSPYRAGLPLTPPSPPLYRPPRT